jgi:hypothetical protein
MAPVNAILGNRIAHCRGAIRYRVWRGSRFLAGVESLAARQARVYNKGGERVFLRIVGLSLG